MITHNTFDFFKTIFSHDIMFLFIATVTHNTSETWYKKLLDMIDLQQQQQIWMSERKVSQGSNLFLEIT